MILKKLSHLIPLALLAVSTASAAIIDFTSNAWSGANNVSSHSVGGVTLTATGAALSLSTPFLTFNGSSCGNAGVGLACQGDGIGINSRTFAIVDIFVDQTDEVDLSEVLTITFATPTNIAGLDVLNLFANESVQVSVNGGAFSFVFNGSNTTGGFHATGFAANNVSTLALRGGRPWQRD